MKNVTVVKIEHKIFMIRGQRVMLDRDLAQLYRVSTKALNQAVKRNKERFPGGFMFRLSKSETRELVTNCDRFHLLKHTAVEPLAFTDYGVAMLSSVLRSQRAIQVNIQIIRTFIRLRHIIANHGHLAQKIDQLEKKITTHDSKIRSIFDAIRELMRLPQQSKDRIGFRT